MTGWDLGWLSTRSGGLRTSLGRQKSPFRKPPMIKGSFLCLESHFAGLVYCGWLRDLRCIGFSRKINDPFRNRCKRGESGFAQYWLTCHHVISYKFILKKRRIVLLSKFTPPNASVETNFGDLLILRWSRLEIPWKSFSLGVFLIHFLILSHVSRKEFGKWPDTLPPICIKLKRKTWWVEIFRIKMWTESRFCLESPHPFRSHPPFWFLRNASQRHVAALSTPVIYWGKRVANLHDLSVYPIRNFIPTHIRRVPLLVQGETSDQRQKGLKFAWERLLSSDQKPCWGLYHSVI